MDPRAILNRSVSTGVRLGRGTADRLVHAAGPTLGRLSDRVVRTVRRPEPPTTTTFTPSKPPPPEQGAAARAAAPSPATVAGNIGPQRPVAKPPRSAKPKSAPGA